MTDSIPRYGLYQPICPHCDWVGAPDADALQALADSDVHVAVMHDAKLTDDNEPLGVFAETVRALEQEAER